ncbi:response regulator [Saccharothrix yanglingensis]|uniref:DNA-binding response regulator n=1 Tax=Saccharothrix yanglingensis TaxID=659496 RepID=A0ABU0X599_9PSEU|nr:response regulator transcription factor [Saccharothrix yanglingensis]MDQ2587323.1 DNA-binding response regulator [Saccharothrix yanglingensis]
MIRVVVVDDEALIRSGLRMILEASGDISVVAEAGDGAEAVRVARSHRPHVVLLDVRMPVMDGLAATSRLMRLDPAPKVVILTTFDLDEYVHTALRHGAVGFLLKDTPPRDLAEAVRTVAAGNAMLAPGVTRRLIAAFAAREPDGRELASRRLAALTARELQVARQVAAGHSNVGIGARLTMSEATVKAHISRALAKLSLANRVQLAMLVHDAGLDREPDRG